MEYCHNPYFNRWFSAILGMLIHERVQAVTILILIDGFLQYTNRQLKNRDNRCHNPYFNRWFSAIKMNILVFKQEKKGHNPYFNRWFSAINSIRYRKSEVEEVTILILIDGFLQ